MTKKKIETKKMKPKGIADDVDRHVGSRLRMRRSLLGYSQEKLAEFVGVTFQQIQKYERGSNRLSASRLLSFSQLLEVPINFFFEGLEEAKKSKGSAAIGFAEGAQEGFEGGPSRKTKDVTIMNQKETIDLLKVYYSVKDTKLRKEILKIVKSMAKNMS